MSKQQIYILTCLLKGMYLARTKNFYGVTCFKLFEGNMNPVCYVYRRTIRSVMYLIREEKGKYVANLKEISKLHARNRIKIEYNKIQSLA